MQNTQNTGAPRINLFDVLLIILAVAVVAGLIILAVRALPDENVSGGKLQIKYSVTATGLPAGIDTQIKPGDNVYDHKTGVFIGVVQSATSSQTVLPGYNERGKYVENRLPDSYDVTVVIAVSGTFDGSGYYANGIHIVSGKSLELHTSSVYLNGSCVLLSTVEGDGN